MISGDIQLQKWMDTATARIQMLHLDPGKELELQAGRLAQTLLQITPQAKAANVQRQVSTKFKTLGQDNPHAVSDYAEGGKAGRGDVRWYAFQPDAIFGVAEDYDLRNASVEGLWSVHLQAKLNKQGRIMAGNRGKQRVLIWQKYLTQAETVKGLIAKIKKHIGRAKAGWLPSWRALGSPTGIISSPSDDAMRNESGARGTANVSTSGKSPFVEMRNFAVGISRLTQDAKSGSLFTRALRIRTEAMKKDLQFAIHHPDKWRQREADAGRL